MNNQNCECNSGVRCNVNECVYNEKGCECNKEVIDVSLGDGQPMSNGKQKHFCKSFICKKADCDYAQTNVEASTEFDMRHEY